MGTQFEKPDFSKKNLELRFENDVVCLYGTAQGLKKLADLCLSLIENPDEGHIHLEDLGILTKRSLRGAIAIFDNVKL